MPLPQYLDARRADRHCAAGARFPGAIPWLNGVSAKLLSPSEAVDTSYKIFTSVREVRFLEMEYAIPRERLGAALRETRELVERMGGRIDVSSQPGAGSTFTFDLPVR